MYKVVINGCYGGFSLSEKVKVNSSREYIFGDKSFSRKKGEG